MDRDKMVLDAVALVLRTPCNYKCKFCPNHGDKGNKIVGAALSPEHLNTIFSKLKGRTKLLNISATGDPLLYAHIDDLFEALPEGLDANLLTNGFLLERIEPYLDKLNGICFSLHGGDAATQDYLSGVPGSFDKVTESMDKINSGKFGKLKMSINFVINKYNYETMEEAIPFLLEKGASNIRVSHMIFNPKSGWVNFDLLEGMDIEKLIQIMKKLETYKNVDFFPDMTEAQIRKYYEYDKYFLFDPDRCHFFTKTSEIKMFRITGNGDVGIACIPKIGNLVDQELDEILSYEKIDELKQWHKQLVEGDKGLPEKKCSRCCFNGEPIAFKRGKAED